MSKALSRLDTYTSVQNSSSTFIPTAIVEVFTIYY